MDRDKSKGPSAKRGLKVKSSKSARPSPDTSEPKPSVKSSLSSAPGSSSEHKRDSNSQGNSSASNVAKKQKVSASSPITPIVRPVTQPKSESLQEDEWESLCIEVDSSDLLVKVLEAEDANDDERVEGLLCGAVRQLKNSRSKPEASLYLSLMYLAKTRPLLYCSSIVVEAFCSLLKRDVTLGFKTKGNSLVSVLAANVLLAAYHDEGSWPDTFIKVFLEDSVGDRVWVDHVDCKGFVDNILTAFNTKMPPKSMMAPELSFKPEACPSPPAPSLDDDESSVSSISQEMKEHLENIEVLPRYTQGDDIEQYVLDMIRDQLGKRQPMDISRNMIRLLISTSGLSEVRLLVAQRLEMWLQNPKLTRPAQDLLLAVCLNCNQHNQKDVEVISLLIRIRLKTKPLINHFLQSIKELLSQHTDNLSTVLKNAIYNELSNSRNPNNMQLLSVIFQHSPDRAAKVLAEVFQDLLTNRDDYLRALRALFREIVRTLRHDLNFQAFCLGLMEERREPVFRDLDQQLKERLFLSLADLIVLSIFLAISPAVREAASAYARGDKKDITILRSYQLQVAIIQRDSVWWLHTVVPKMFKPAKNEFVHCLHKLLFMEQAEHYYNKDNWPPENERPLMLRLASEIPVLEDTLMRVLAIGLSKDHPLNAPDALELADQLVKRASALYMEDYPVVRVAHPDLFNAVFNLCAYHHPDNISLPPGYQPPGLAIAELYWKAWIMLLIVVAHNPSNFGQSAWENYPTLRSMMEMCITNSFSFPPPTIAFGEKADEIRSRELQISQLERQAILEFESHLAAASTKVTITESNSLLLSKLITMDPLGVARRPPSPVLDQMKTLNQNFKLGHLLCRSRSPDFLLDIIQRQGTSQSMPWLAELVESSEGSFSMLPVQCLCEFLLNEAPSGIGLGTDTSNKETSDETKLDKSEKLKKKEKQRKQKELLQHLQMLLHEPSKDPSPTCEVLDYFMRRLSSPQPSARKLASKGLSLVLSQPNHSPMSDDEDIMDKSEIANEHAWLLKDLPSLPHFETVKLQASLLLRQACKIENDPGAISAYVRFLSAHAPDDNQQIIGDLAVDMAELIIDRPTIISCILPPDGCSKGSSAVFLIAISEIFTKYLRKVKKPSKEVFPWCDTQDHILVRWQSGEGAVMHVLVVHAMVVLLTFGPPEANRRHFDELLETWCPTDGEYPQAFLIDTSEEALLFPDWLKLRMIRSNVDSLVVAALKDLDPAQLVLFIQSFGIPVSSMTKLLHTLDNAVEQFASEVEAAVVDKAYMSQLVEVQQQRGARGGEKFAELIREREDVPMEDVDGPLTSTSQTRVIQRAPPKPPVAVSLNAIPNTILELFGLPPSKGVLSVKQEQELFRSLQKALTQDILKKSGDSEAVAKFIKCCEQILDSDQKNAFIQGLHKKSSFSCVLFRLITAAQAKAPGSVLALKLSQVCCQILANSSQLKSAPLLNILKQYVDHHGERKSTKVSEKGWQNKLKNLLSLANPTPEDIISVIRTTEDEEPVRLEEVIHALGKHNIQRGNTKSLTIAITRLLVEDVFCISSVDEKKTSQFCLLIDWLENLEPDLIGTCPELQQQLLFFKTRNGSKEEMGLDGHSELSESVTPSFRPYLLSLLIHQAGWETLHQCIQLVLKPKSNVRYDSSSVLDFLWACIHIPKIWQGRDKKTPKHNVEEDVLGLSPEHLLRVIDYIIEEAVEKIKTERFSDTTSEKVTVQNDSAYHHIESVRLPLLIRCCSSQASKVECCVNYLLDIICSSKHRACDVDVARNLLLLMYLQIPSLILSVTSNPASLLVNSGKTLTSYSKLDVITHTMIISMSTTDASKLCAERMADLSLACQKMASAHPVLFLRQLPMLAAVLRGRVHLEFSVFKLRNHLTLFNYVLGFLMLLPPYLFHAEYSSSLMDVFSSYIELFETYLMQNKELLSLFNQFLLLLHQYVNADPQNARQFLQKYTPVLQDIACVYPDLSSLKILLAGTCLPVQGSSDWKEGIREGSATPALSLPSTSQSTPSWLHMHLIPLATRLAPGGNPDDMRSALSDLENISNKQPNILEYFQDELKRLIQDTNSCCRMAAFGLMMRYLKQNPRDSSQFLSSYLQCLENEEQDVVLTALDHLPEFVLLSQEHAPLILQKAFAVGINYNINTAPQICETIALLNMQSGS